MNKFNLFGKGIVIFIITLCLGILFLCFYYIIKPEKDIDGYNFSPYPNFSPKDIPDNNINSSSDSTCFTTLTACDSNNQCSSCGSEYTCTNSTKDGQYTFNNMSVPAGAWCLPQNLSKQLCNDVTGSWIWVNDPSYCQILNRDIGNTSNTGQCWACICKYPNLYTSSSPKFDCTVPVQNGVLTATIDAQNDTNGAIKVGEIWDPTSNLNTKILQYNPYQRAANGNPYFKMGCNSSTGYSSLSHDPYTCHRNVCSVPGSMDNTNSAFNETTQTCTCENGLYEIPIGDLQGKCFNPSNVCVNGNWTPGSYNAGSCGSCGATSATGNTMYSSFCNSNYVNHGSGFANCSSSTMNNPVGVECIDLCPASLTTSCVANGGTLETSTTNGVTTCKCNCSTCPTKSPQTDSQCKPQTWVHSGTSCGTNCLESGSIIKVECNGVGCPCSSNQCVDSCGGYSSSNCCSQVSTSTTDNWPANWLPLTSTITTTCA